MVNVAIIDDGISIGFYDINNIVRSIEITPDIIVQDSNKYKLHNRSHGTICAAIVKKYYPDAIFTSVKILNDKNHKANKEQLVKAIQWCMDNGIQVANISLGTIDYRDFELIMDIINKAYSRGLIIIAAYSNKDVFTYPASCSNVIGVKCSCNDKLLEGEFIFNLYPLDGIEVTACSEHILLENGIESMCTTICNSYAAPMITAEVCKIIEKQSNITLEKIKQGLYKISINYLGNTIRVNNYKNIDWISNAAVFNMNKYRSFKLPYRNQTKIFKEIKDIKDIYSNLFDTLVIFNNSPKDSGKVKSIISKLESKKKNIIVINDEYQDENYEVEHLSDNVKLWQKSMVKHFFNEALPKKKREVPLIVVYDYTKGNLVKIVGTLTSKFRSDGYYAIGASTKSIGALYGLEYISINIDENIKKVKDKIEALYKVYEYDILILGISTDKEDINKINMYLDTDKTIICVDEFTHKIERCLEKTSVNDYLIINSQKDINLLYEEVLNMFLCENE